MCTRPSSTRLSTCRAGSRAGAQRSRPPLSERMNPARPRARRFDGPTWACRQPVKNGVGGTLERQSSRRRSAGRCRAPGTCASAPSPGGITPPEHPDRPAHPAVVAVPEGHHQEPAAPCRRGRRPGPPGDRPPGGLGPGKRCARRTPPAPAGSIQPPGRGQPASPVRPATPRPAVAPAPGAHRAEASQHFAGHRGRQQHRPCPRATVQTPLEAGVACILNPSTLTTRRDTSRRSTRRIPSRSPATRRILVHPGTAAAGDSASPRMRTGRSARRGAAAGSAGPSQRRIDRPSRAVQLGQHAAQRTDPRGRETGRRVGEPRWGESMAASGGSRRLIPMPTTAAGGPPTAGPQLDKDTGQFAAMDQRRWALELDTFTEPSARAGQPARKDRPAGTGAPGVKRQGRRSGPRPTATPGHVAPGRRSASAASMHPANHRAGDPHQACVGGVTFRHACRKGQPCPQRRHRRPASRASYPICSKIHSRPSGIATSRSVWTKQGIRSRPCRRGAAG